MSSAEPTLTTVLQGMGPVLKHNTCVVIFSSLLFSLPAHGESRDMLGHDETTHWILCQESVLSHI